jgi:hypothetical protein
VLQRVKNLCYAYGMKQSTCNNCHIPFTAKRSDAKTCSTACRVALSRKNQDEEKRRKRLEADRERQRYRHYRDNIYTGNAEIWRKDLELQAELGKPVNKYKAAALAAYDESRGKR